MFFFIIVTELTVSKLQQAAVFSEKALKKPEDVTCSATNKKLVDIVEHLAAKEPDISLGSW